MTIEPKAQHIKDHGIMTFIHTIEEVVRNTKGISSEDFTGVWEKVCRKYGFRKDYNAIFRTLIETRSDYTDVFRATVYYILKEKGL